ncbi:unnamed protein product [Lathyrus oleraceus]|nr:protein SOB FIVE-LIKE 5-like [Pisum sativum]KAI5393300.1 hypothetical protein KIW84_060426 [Pisum sativum]
MDKSTSQYSESGWTHYLDQSIISESCFKGKGEYEYERKGERMNEKEFEEDSSMVSDASSGPPHYDNEENYCENFYHCLSSRTKESNKRKKVKEYERSQQSSPLDDTASSPFFSCPNKSHKKQDSFLENGAVENNAIQFSECKFATRIKRKTGFYKAF